MATSITTTTSTSTDYDNVVVVLRARAHAREEVMRRQAAALDAAADYWRMATGLQLPPVARRRIAELIDVGMDAELIADAIDATSAAPRPSWAYCAAILSRLEREGIKSAAENAEKQACRRAKPGKIGANGYEQRDYSNDKLKYLFENED